MAFEIGIAYGVASLIAIALGYAGLRNRRSGYHRDREDTVLDILITAAASRAEPRSARAADAPTVGVQDASLPMTTGAQLAALSAALEEPVRAETEEPTGSRNAS